MKVYKFDSPRKTDTLSNGKIRCYYTEQLEELVIEKQEAEDEDQPEDDVITLYTYNAVDLDGELTKSNIVNAIIREKYSQADVEAIMRHKIAGEEGSEEEFSSFNSYAEQAKLEANRILSL